MARAATDDSASPTAMHRTNRLATRASDTNVIAEENHEGVTVHTKTKTEPLSTESLGILRVIGDNQQDRPRLPLQILHYSPADTMIILRSLPRDGNRRRHRVMFVMTASVYI